MLNCAAVHAFCNVVNRDGEGLGKFDFDLFDVCVLPERAGGIWRGSRAGLRRRLCWSSRIVEAENSGSNLRFAQSAAWNGSETVTGSLSAGFVESAPPPTTVVERVAGGAARRVDHEVGRG